MNIFKSQNTLQRKIFIYVFLISSIPLLFLSFFSYLTYLQDTSEKNNMALLSTNQQFQTQVEANLTRIKEYYSNAVKNEHINWLRISGNMQYNQVKQLHMANSILTGSGYIHDIITGYSFINFDDNWVLSNQGMYPLSEATNQVAITTLKDTVLNNSSLHWINNSNISPSPLFQSKTLNASGYLLTIFLPSTSTLNECLLIVNIHNKVFSIPKIPSKELYTLAVLDDQGQIVFTNNPLIPLHPDLSSTPLSESLVQPLRKKSQTIYPFTRDRSQDFPLIYTASYNLNNLNTNPNQVLFVLLIFTIIILSSLLLSITGAHFLAKPFQRLKNQLKKLPLALAIKDVSPDDFTWLETNIYSLWQNNTLLENELQKNQPALMELFFLRLLQGELQKSDIKFHLEQLKYTPAKYFLCICFYPNTTEGRYTSHADFFVNFNALEQKIKDICLLYTLNLKEKSTVVLNASTQSQLYDLLSLLDSYLLGYTKNTNVSTFSIGVSQVFSKLEQIPLAYSESIETLKTNILLQEENFSCRDTNLIGFFPAQTPPLMIWHNFDIHFKPNLLKAITEFDYEEASKQVDLFFEELQKINLIALERYFYYFQFLNLFLQTLLDDGQSISKIFHSQPQYLYFQLEHMYTETQIKLFFKDILKETISQLKNNKISPTVNLSANLYPRILALVKSTQGDITLTECADKLKCHPSSIWKVLKSKDMTFTEFIGIYKIQLAKELLVHTHLSIKEIAEQLSYTNAQNFIRYFSKQVQMTPGNFRRQYQSKIPTKSDIKIQANPQIIDIPEV